MTGAGREDPKKKGKGKANSSYIAEEGKHGYVVLNVDPDQTSLPNLDEFGKGDLVPINSGDPDHNPGNGSDQEDYSGPSLANQPQQYVDEQTEDTEDVDPDNTRKQGLDALIDEDTDDFVDPDDTGTEVGEGEGNDFDAAIAEAGYEEQSDNSSRLYAPGDVVAGCEVVGVGGHSQDPEESHYDAPPTFDDKDVDDAFGNTSWGPEDKGPFSDDGEEYSGALTTGSRKADAKGIGRSPKVSSRMQRALEGDENLEDTLDGDTALELAAEGGDLKGTVPAGDQVNMDQAYEAQNGQAIEEDLDPRELHATNLAYQILDALRLQESSFKELKIGRSYLEFTQIPTIYIGLEKHPLIVGIGLEYDTNAENIENLVIRAAFETRYDGKRWKAGGGWEKIKKYNDELPDDSQGFFDIRYERTEGKDSRCSYFAEKEVKRTKGKDANMFYYEITFTAGDFVMAILELAQEYGIEPDEFCEDTIEDPNYDVRKEEERKPNRRLSLLNFFNQQSK